MLAFSVQSEQYVPIKKRKSNIDKRIDVAARWTFCVVVLGLAHLLTDALLEAGERMNVPHKAGPDPFLAQSQTARSRLRGTLTYIDLVKPIQTGSTTQSIGTKASTIGGAKNRSTENLDERPNGGFKFRHPEELANPDLHIR